MAVRSAAPPLAAPRGRLRLGGPGGPRAGAMARAGGGGWLLALPLGFLTIFLLGPLLMVALSAGGITGLHHALTDRLVGDALGRTLLIALLVTGSSLLLGVIYALALVSTRGVVRAALVGALLASFWVSVLVRTLGWELLEEPHGLLDSALHALRLLDPSAHLEILQTTRGMAPAMVNVMLPYMVLPVWAALGSLDRDQLRAARSLGASPWLVLTRVVLPQARTGIAAGALLTFTLSLGFYITPRLLGGPADVTIGALVGSQFEASQTGDISEPAAVGLLLVAAVLVLYAVSDRVLRVSDAWSRA
ncbi:MAG: ABC transporter permease [Candidatus Dormibacteria bacterium]